MILAKPGALQQVPVGMRGARRPRHNTHNGTAPREDGLAGVALWPCICRTKHGPSQTGLRIPPKPGTTAVNPENTSDKSKLRHILQNTWLILQYSSKPLRSLKANKRQTWKTITIQRSWGRKTGERKRQKDFPGAQRLGLHCRRCLWELRSHRQRRQRSLRRHGLSISWDRTREKLIRSE